MTTTDRYNASLLAFAILVLVLFLSACGGPPKDPDEPATTEQALVQAVGTVSTHIVDMQQPIIYAAMQMKLPPNPHSPSSDSRELWQLTVEDANIGGNGFYFAVESSSNFLPTPTQHFERGYIMEMTGRNNSVVTDPVFSVNAFPGDTVTAIWYGYTTPPSFLILNDNASGKQSGPISHPASYTLSTVMTEYTTPFVSMVVNTTNGLGIPPIIHNCTGDLPASNKPSHVSETIVITDIVTGDYAHHFPAFDQPYNNTNPNLSPANCAMAISARTDGTGSTIDSYGY